MPRDREYTHRGKRSRAARERRALTKTLNSHPTLGVRQERTGRFFVNHEKLTFAATEHVPDDPPPPRDGYFIAQPGAVYVEVCDKCKRPNENPHCKTCHGACYTRGPHGETISERRRSA